MESKAILNRLDRIEGFLKSTFNDYISLDDSCKVPECDLSVQKESYKSFLDTPEHNAFVERELPKLQNTVTISREEYKHLNEDVARLEFICKVFLLKTGNHMSLDNLIKAL